MPTTDPVPSSAAQDLLFNAQKLDEVVSGTSDTYVDRLGVPRLTLQGALKLIGYEPPVAFASGIAITRGTQTVVESGLTYHANPSSLPFTTTSTFVSGQWLLLSNITAQDLASTSDDTKGAGMVACILAATGAVKRTQRDKNSDWVTTPDFGAVGDGSTDDTTAVTATQAALLPYSGLNKKHLFSIAGYYNFASPAFTADGFTVRDTAIKVKAGTYYKGTPGDIDYYSMWRLQGNNQLAFNLQFDGNAQANYAAFAPAGQNVWMIPIQMTTGKTGQKAIANAIDSGGGHAIEGSSGSRMHIALNSATKHNGVGTTSTSGAALVGNISDTTSDAHYFMNTVSNGVAVGNVGTTSNNGGALDLSGNTNVAAVGNVMSGAQQNGTWVLKSPNTSALYSRNLVASNLFYDNCAYPNNEQGEIQIGDFNHLGEAQGSDVAVIGNFALPQDTPGAAGFNAAIWVHAQATRTAVVANVLSPADALLSNTSSAEFLDKGSIKPIYAGNVSFGDTPARIKFDTNPSGYSHYANNVNVRIHPDSVGIPSTMESSDGVWTYHIVRTLTKAGKAVLDIFYTGGYVHDVIEITLAQANDNGAIQNRIVSRGSSGAATTVLANTSIFTLGTHPPTIATDTSVNGRLRITAATAAAGFDSELCSFYIRVVTHADAPSRFVPIFA